METNINYEVFEHEDGEDNFSYQYPVSPELQKVAKEMVLGGFAKGNIIYIDKFLREDKSINLEKLEIATILVTKWLEANISFDDPLFIYIANLDRYYELRGIQDKTANKKEEYYVIRGIVESVANNESVKPIKVDYVFNATDSFARGQ